MKKYGVRGCKTMRLCYACCQFDNKIDDDDYFGTDDINEAYHYVNHCDAPELMEVFEKEVK